jgi:hypothetical protein
VALLRRVEEVTVHPKVATVAQAITPAAITSLINPDTGCPRLGKTR